MRKLMTLLVGTSALAMATPAKAATFVFSGGNYIPGVTAPEPLMSPDILELTTGSNKFFNNVTMTNQTGTVNWNAGNLFMANGATISNQSLWDAKGDNSLNNSGGPLSTFNNSGIFRKSAGAGSTSISNIAFVNSGTVDAQTGSIDFVGSNAMFNAGSIFTGAGAVNIASNATFIGASSSSNLNFVGGIFGGNAAALSGTADWAAGTFSGDWNLTGGSTLTATTGSNKFFNATSFTNDGTINWTGGNAFFVNGSQWINNGLVDYSATQSLNNSGGPVSTITNSASGTFHVDAGQTVTIANTFVNNGGTITADGIFAFTGNNATFGDNSVFNGAGINAINSSSAFVGDISSTNLSFNGGTFSGNAAALSGTANWAAGTFAGGWNLTAASTLTATTGSNKFFNAATFTNDGTINWSGGNAFFANGAQLINNGLVDYSTTQSLNNSGGPVSTIINSASGTFHVDAGQTVTIANTFVNNGGTITADGTFAFNGSNATFGDNSVFNGAGTNGINSSSAFIGDISSTNVSFNGGTFSGNQAALSGTADWAGGTFAGDWNLTAGSTLNATTGSNKFFNATSFTNDGTINWTGGNMFFANGSHLINNGNVNVRSDNSINNSGGPASSFTNNGLIQKTAGTGTTTLASGIALDNNGTINVLSGTIALPAAFNNDGTLGGTGTFASTNLTNGGSIAPGASGATGTLALTGNFFQSAGGFLNSQLASSGSSDLFNISGTAGISGTLALSCILGCAINTGDSFVLLDSIGALSGTFSNITTSGFRNGFSFNIIYDYGADLVRLNVLDAGLVGGGVPEPSTWAMLILGFGMVGRAMRKRSTTRASVLA